MRPWGAVAAALLLVASCSGEDDGQPGQPANTVVLDGTVANDHGSASVTASGEHLSVTAGDFFFEPTVVTGPAGQAVVLDVSSGAESVHNLTSDDLSEDIPPGDTVQFELTFPESGTYVFVCRYHEDRGMAGALVSN